MAAAHLWDEQPIDTQSRADPDGAIVEFPPLSPSPPHLVEKGWFLWDSPTELELFLFGLNRSYGQWDGSYMK